MDPVAFTLIALAGLAIAPKVVPFIGYGSLALIKKVQKKIKKEKRKMRRRNKELQKKMIENQKKYIVGDACEKIAEIVIKELDRGNVKCKNKTLTKI